MRRRGAVRRLIRLLLLILVVAVLGNFALGQFGRKEKIKNQQDIASIATPTPIPENAQLRDVVEASLKGTKGTYGIVIKNFKTGETYARNEKRVFEPGSLYKLWVMPVVLDQVRTGKLQKDEVLTEKVEVLNDKFHIATESAELTEGEISFTVNDALSQMITISHNYATFLLAAKVRLSNVESFLQEEGFVHSELGQPPHTTPSDIALYFEKLYKGELAGEKETAEMIELLKNQRLNNKIPKYLPEGTVVAHKTGELGDFTHDAGIIYTPNGEYLFVMLSESDNPGGAEERIAQTSQSVYAYFEQK